MPDAWLKPIAAGTPLSGTGTTIIRFDRRLAGKLGADVLAHLVNGFPVGDRVRPREIDMLEDAGPRLDLGERPEGADAGAVDQDQLAGLDVAQESRADDVQRDGLGREDRRFAELAHDQGPNAERIAAGDQSILGQHEERVSALDLLQRIGQAVEVIGDSRRSRRGG